MVTDWSRRGVGYILWQKRCQCPEFKLECCKPGWVVVAVGSRFCTAAETRYAPIEGELLGVVWALKKTSHYTLGCPRCRGCAEVGGSCCDLGFTPCYRSV